MQRSKWGDSLRDHRTAAGLSQRATAAAVGVSHSVIARVESGARVPRDALRVRLARLFDVEPHVLFPYALVDELADDGLDEELDDGFDDEELLVEAVAS